MSTRTPGRRPLPFALVVVALLAALGVLIALNQTSDGSSTPEASASPRPTVSHTPSPSPSPKTTPRAPLLIHGAGDVSLDPDYIPNFRSYGYGYAWSGLNGLFQRDDLTVVNLECPVSHLGAPLPKEFTFEGDPAALPAMRDAGVEVASMANNHAYDYGPEALLDTRKNIEQAGIAPVGGGVDPAEAVKPAIFHLKGWTVAVVGIDEVIDPPEEVSAPGHPGTACGHDVGCDLRAIRAASEQTDLVVVIIHWGVELDTQPRGYQIDEAHRFIDAGADVIFGSHAHRLQPMGSYRGRPIFWGLGNFVWPHLSEDGSRTAVAEVVARPNGTFSGRLIPVYINPSGHPVLTG